MYIYQLKDWPKFKWNEKKISKLLAEVRHLQGKLLGNMTSLGFSLQLEANLQTLTLDTIKASEIEGENLDYQQVRSSIAKRLGIKVKPLKVNRNIEGLVKILLDCTENYDQALTEKRLFGWHNALFPNSKNSLKKLVIGQWRNKASGKMQVVSGAIGREKVHYEAPSYAVIKKEMQTYITWFNQENEIDLVIKSALAHFWFVTIHPFDDGNGRIARALADLLLAKSENCCQRFYSMSAQIRLERNNYYKILESSQKGNLDLSLWIEWYLNCLKSAIVNTTITLESILIKAKFWKNNSAKQFNKRQTKVLNLLLDGFEGKLTSSKWAKINKCSQDTAHHDINTLLASGVLKREAGGRSTYYVLM